MQLLVLLSSTSWVMALIFTNWRLLTTRLYLILRIGCIRIIFKKLTNMRLLNVYSELMYMIWIKATRQKRIVHCLNWIWLGLLTLLLTWMLLLVLIAACPRLILKIAFFTCGKWLFFLRLTIFCLLFFNFLL